MVFLDAYSPLILQNRYGVREPHPMFQKIRRSLAWIPLADHCAQVYTICVNKMH